MLCPALPNRKMVCRGRSGSWASPSPEDTVLSRGSPLALLISVDLFFSPLCSRASGSPCLCISVVTFLESPGQEPGTGPALGYCPSLLVPGHSPCPAHWSTRLLPLGKPACYRGWPSAGVWELWGLPSIPRTDESGRLCPHCVQTARSRPSARSPPGGLEFRYVPGRGCLWTSPP